MSQRSTGRPVFDASAVLALLQNEPGSDRLLELQDDAVISAVNAAEVLAKLVNRGMPAGHAQVALDALHLETVPFDSTMAGFSARYVARGVSLGDRCFLATVQHYGSGWTSDRDLAALAGISTLPLNFFR